jgi:hypothetical protein
VRASPLTTSQSLSMVTPGGPEESFKSF